MEIPKSFQIFGETWKVKQLVKVDKKDNLGECDLANNIIKIKKCLNQEQKEQTYLHEVMHCILDNLGHDELCMNEVLVDTIAKALHQIIKTSK